MTSNDTRPLSRTLPKALEAQQEYLQAAAKLGDDDPEAQRLRAVFDAFEDRLACECEHGWHPRCTNGRCEDIVDLRQALGKSLGCDVESIQNLRDEP